MSETTKQTVADALDQREYAIRFRIERFKIEKEKGVQNPQPVPQIVYDNLKRIQEARTELGIEDPKIV